METLALVFDDKMIKFTRAFPTSITSLSLNTRAISHLFNSFSNVAFPELTILSLTKNGPHE